MTYEQLHLAVYRLLVDPDTYFRLWDDFEKKYGKSAVAYVEEKVASGELKLP